jgi:hypothetical protein
VLVWRRRDVAVGTFLNGIETFTPDPLSLSMAHLNATLASVFRASRRSASASWTQLGDDHEFSQLCSKYWGRKIEEEARDSERPTVVADRTNDIGPECFGLDLGIEFQPPRLWVRQDYVRIYDYCSQRHEEGPSEVTEMARSVVITGQPGVGALLSSVGPSAYLITPCEKVKVIGSLTRCAVVSANRSLFFGIKLASATYSSRMVCLKKTPQMSSAVTRRHSYGRSSMPTHIHLVFPKASSITPTYISCSPPIRSEIDGSLS